jgi:hypothetical protein
MYLIHDANQLTLEIQKKEKLKWFNLSHLSNLVRLYNYVLHIVLAHNLLSNHVAKYSMNLAHELQVSLP